MKNNKRCIHRHTPTEHPKCFENLEMLGMSPLKYPKILIVDVETLPIVGYAWSAWNQNIYPEQIIKDWCILSYSAKWLYDSKIISDVLTSNEAISRDDRRIIFGIWKLLDNADIVITHNGKRFDIRKLNTRFWKNDLPKPSSYKSIDTLIAAKSIFGLTYNKLNFIAKFIGADEKLSTEFSLWINCDNGNKNALKEMKKYNEQDILTLEEIYMEMREWIPNHPDLRIYQNIIKGCPICLENNYKEIGLYTANKLQYKEYRCSVCGSIWHNSKPVRR